MTQVTGTRRSLAPAPVPSRRSILTAALLAAGWLFLLGLTLVGTAVLIGWATTAHADTSASQALRAAAQVWLACQHVPVQLPIGVVSLLPLGLLLLPGILGYRTGRWAAEAAVVRELGPAITLTVGAAATYGLLAALLAGITHTQVGAAAPAQGFAGAFLIAFLSIGVGVLRAADLWLDLLARIPRPVRPVLHEVAIVLMVLLGSAAALVCIALALHVPASLSSVRSLGAAGPSGLLLVLLGVAYLPDAILWALAYLAGPGFAVGNGTLVSPLGHLVGTLPNFPMLAGIPVHRPGWAPVLLLVPVAAGVLVAWRRRSRGVAGADLPRVLADALAVAAVVGLVVAALTTEAAGSLGPGRLANVGPDGVAVGAATAALVLLGLGLGVLASLVERRFAD
jgi:hypothetical protein